VMIFVSYSIHWECMKVDSYQALRLVSISR
jgi:hypothetical protein